MLETAGEPKKNIIAIHQPNYIPWLGYFYKIHQSDIFVFLDDVQYSNQGMHNYHYIKTSQGPFRLKIPVNIHFGGKIFEVTTRDELKWKTKHLKTLEANYRKAPFFEEVFADFESWIKEDQVSLAKKNIAIIRSIAEKLGISTRFMVSSGLGLQSQKEEKIIDICNLLKGKIYYSGTGARAYQDESNFLSNGIELRYSVFKPFEYPQLWNGFQSNVTVIDYLMNCGYDWNQVLKSQEKE